MENKVKGLNYMREDEYIKFTVSDLYRVLNNLDTYIYQEEYVENIEEVMSLINKYDNVNLIGEDEFSTFVSYKQQTFNEVLVKVLLGKEQEDTGNDYTEEQVLRLVNFYQHIITVNKLLEETIIKYEGLPMSSDKSRTILREYGKQLRGKSSTLEWNKQDYWIPDNGSKEQWLTYTEGILELLRGNSQLYIDTKQELEGLLRKVKDEKEQHIRAICTSHEFYIGETKRGYEDIPVYHFKQTLEDVEDLHAEMSVTKRGTIYRVYKNNHLGDDIKVEKDGIPVWVTDLLEKLR